MQGTEPNFGRNDSDPDHSLDRLAPERVLDRRTDDADSAATIGHPESDPVVNRQSATDYSLAGQGLKVRCPHCRNPIELVDTDSLQELMCPSCGSSFSLVDGDSTATYAQPAVKQLGHFELVEQLGMGAFGSVWKARDTELDRVVAIKIPRKDRMHPEETQKFFREARAAAQLRHPSIVSVHEVGRDGDTVYIVSDLVRGVTLSDWLSGQTPTPREAAELCAQIADALHHAHEQGVIHRDLKPGNIMLDAEGRPHIMDFGLAKREAGEITMTAEGQVLGTPAYMSPEQARGEGHEVDRRTDVYSLGVILFQLLTGELPFRGTPRMLLHQVLNDEPRSPRSLNDRIPRDLETICLKAMAKEPSRRYESTSTFGQDLGRYLSGKPIMARPIGHFERGWRWAYRNRELTGLIALATTLLLAGTCISVFFAIAANRNAAIATQNELLATSNAANLRIEKLRVEASLQRAEKLRNKAEAEQQRAEHHLRESLKAVQGLADVLNRAEIYDVSESLYRHAVALSMEANDEGGWLSSIRGLASTLLELDRFEEARALFSEAVVRGKQFDGLHHWATFDALAGLAKSNQLLGDSSLAVSNYREAVELGRVMRARGDLDAGRFFDVVKEFTVTLDQLGVADEAEATLRDCGLAASSSWQVKWYTWGEYALPDATACPEQVFDQLPHAESTEKAINFAWGHMAPRDNISPDFFALSAEAQLSVDDGSYEVHSISDDGVRVWIDDSIVIDNWPPHAPVEDVATVRLSAGPHVIRVRFFELDRGATLRLWFLPIEEGTPRSEAGS